MREKNLEPCWGCKHRFPADDLECPKCGVSVHDVKEFYRLNASNPQSPYLDNVHGYQEIAEVEAVRDWAQEMSKKGHSICEITPNPDDPPDCFATMDGKRIGIEVTDLFEPGAAPPSLTARQFSKLPKLLGGKAAKPGARTLFDYQQEPWSLRRFQKWLAKTVRTKNSRTPRASALDEQVLLIVIDENFHLQHPIQEYLKETTLSQPSNFNRVYMMADSYMPDGTGDGYHPIFEVSTS